MAEQEVRPSVRLRLIRSIADYYIGALLEAERDEKPLPAGIAEGMQRFLSGTDEGMLPPPAKGDDGPES